MQNRGQYHPHPRSSDMYKENEVDMSPRRRTPGAQQTISRVQLLVPERSMFVPSSTGVSQVEPRTLQPQPHPNRLPLATINGAAAAANTNCADVHLHRMFGKSDMTSDTQTFEYLESLVEKRYSQPQIKESSENLSTSKGVINLLEKQNVEIRELRAQLAQLLVASRQPWGPAEGVLQSQSSSCLPHKTSMGLDGIHYTSSLPILVKNTEDSSTQTSVPSSPLTMRRIASNQQQKRESVEIHVNTSLLDIRSPIVDDRLRLGESATMFNGNNSMSSSGSGNGTEIRSDDDFLPCDEIIDQLERASIRHGKAARGSDPVSPPQSSRGALAAAAPPPTSPTPIVRGREQPPMRRRVMQESRPQFNAKTDDLVSGTCARLEQNGVSFISPEEMRYDREGRRQQPRPPLELNTMYQPGLRIPQYDVDGEGSNAPVSTNSSMAINSAALKYLNDKQLTHMARKHPRSAATNVVERQDDRELMLRKIMATTNRELAAATAVEDRELDNSVTRYGLTESAMTMATKQFLMGNRIVDTDYERREEVERPMPRRRVQRDCDNAVLGDLTQMLRQPKLKP